MSEQVPPRVGQVQHEGMEERQRLAALFAEVSDRLLSDPSQPITFQRVVEGAAEVVPACDDCGMTLRMRRGKVATVASTSADAEKVDNLQYALDEGPCLDATFSKIICVVDDLAEDERWPQWAPGAVEHGYRSVLSLRLHAGDEEIGAMNLYGREPGAFDAESIDLAIIYTAHAARALDQARVISGLQVALESRHDIGIAQGVLAMRYDLSYEEAFTVLHRYSNDRNVKLRDVARQVMDERALPFAPE